MKFIVGIGNPGREYERTRHNVGTMTVDRLAAYFLSKEKKISSWRRDKKYRAMIAQLDDDVCLVKPFTFVNCTGQSLAAIRAKTKISLEDFLIICDDVNLRFGKLRLRPNGSAGGHHGLESILEAFGSDDFPRFRIGVGTDKMPKDQASFVHGKFSSEEEEQINGLLEKVVLVCEMWLNKGFDAAKNRLSHLLSIKTK